jgi:NADPH-dependent 2,4-dienoyl-CoA reductase/sulfur reductase-like enzyme
VRAEGDEQVRRVALTDGQRTWTEECDLFACGFGLVPNVELPLALGCELNDGFVRVDARQATSVTNVFCAGEPTGIGGADCALVEGQVAGYAASGQVARAEALFGPRAGWHRFRARLAKAFALRAELKSLATDETLLCRCEDVTLGRVRQFGSWREAKLQSRCGMGPCQGRVCGAAAKVVLGWGMESVRPPVLPARVQSLISETR